MEESRRTTPPAGAESPGSNNQQSPALPPAGAESSGTNNQQPLVPPPPESSSDHHPETGGDHPQQAAIGYPATAMGYPAPNQRGIPPPYPPPHSLESNYNHQTLPYMQPAAATTTTGKLLHVPNLRLKKQQHASCSIVMYFVARNQIPVFNISSFSVSNFNVSADSFSSVWEANVTMENRFHNVDFHFEHVQSNVYLDNNLLASSSVEKYVNSISVPKNEKGTIPAKVVVNNSKQNSPEPEKSVIEELRNNWKDGSVEFTLQMSLWTSVKESFWRTRHWRIGILCKDVKIEFDKSESPNGKFKGSSKNCNSLF
ncbi:hypothetical protein Dsin_006849 [Dipteronia sinensis]|uniref:Late embryogenesis abundant protein LEA-2 subgroup domain-containing protein n=1 Tax=Dipteronia sinensis TaxID=43782 RepID=A0AAE0EGJ9_9ROSI|nr:hypothetical protein Dsin_006849 [Dipteronia sinensis]